LPTSFFFDTNALILLSGLDTDNLSILNREIAEKEIKICVTHVQIDEKYTHELGDYRQNIEKALEKLAKNGINIIVENTIELVLGISRLGYAKLGSEKLGEIDDALRKEIETCMGKKAKGDLNVASDALIALSSLNHDFFITADRCLFKSWKIVIDFNKENKKAIEQHGYKVPKIIHRKKPKGVFQAIMNVIT